MSDMFTRAGSNICSVNRYGRERRRKEEREGGRENNFPSLRKQVKQTASRYMRWIGLRKRRERRDREEKREIMKRMKEKDDHCHSSNIE